MRKKRGTGGYLFDMRWEWRMKRGLWRMEGTGGGLEKVEVEL